MSCLHDTQTNQTISMVQGEDRTIEVVVRDSSKKLVNLTGAKTYLAVKNSCDDEDALIEKMNLAAGGDSTQSEILDQTTKRGRVQFYLLPEDTEDLDARGYTWQVWVETVGGKRYAVVTDGQLLLGCRLIEL